MQALRNHQSNRAIPIAHEATPANGLIGRILSWTSRRGAGWSETPLLIPQNQDSEADVIPVAATQGSFGKAPPLRACSEMASIKSVSKSRGHALSCVAKKRQEALVRLTCGLLLAYHWLTNGGSKSSAPGVPVARKADFNPATTLQWQVRAADRAAGVPTCR